MLYNWYMKMLVLLASGFEDTELIGTLDIFARNNIEYDLVSVENKNEAQGKYVAKVDTIKLDDIELDGYCGAFMPGGEKCVFVLINSFELKFTLDHFIEEDKIISALCSAPRVLEKLGLLVNQKFTSYPGTVELPNNTGEEVVVDGKLITGRDFRATINFAEEVVKQLKKYCK